jgi:hypothetical protein
MGNLRSWPICAHSMLLILVLLVACLTDDASKVKNVADTGGHRSVAR